MLHYFYVRLQHTLRDSAQKRKWNNGKGFLLQTHQKIRIISFACALSNRMCVCRRNLENAKRETKKREREMLVPRQKSHG
jgi:hypothetical protein